VSSTPASDSPTEVVTPPPTKQKRPIVWMIVAGLAILAAIGLGIWAFTVHSDLNSTQSDLEAQMDATQAAQAQLDAQTEAASAAASELEKISADNEIYVVSNDEVAQAQTDVAEAEQAVADANAAAADANANVDAAKDEAASLRIELDQARAERDLARAQRQQARVCARGSLGVISRTGTDEADQASSELEAVSDACAATMAP
jgi:multidrug resistance efflux pump